MVGNINKIWRFHEKNHYSNFHTIWNMNSIQIIIEDIIYLLLLVELFLPWHVISFINYQQMVFSQIFNFVKVTLFLLKKHIQHWKKLFAKVYLKKKFQNKDRKISTNRNFPSIGGGQYPNITI
jgi:hypothetical protein